MPPFPFIVGRGRSGTTLLRSMLDTHPDMAVPGESHFVVSFARNRRRYERPHRFASEVLAADLEGNWGFKRWGIPKEDLRMGLQAARTYSDAVRKVYALYAQRQGKSRYGDKTPVYVLHLSALAQLFPEATFIHLIRDGRDVALSYLEADFGPSAIGPAAFLWKRFVQQGRRAGQRLGPERYSEVRYEDLLDDPEGTLAQICQFIALPFDLTMLRYFDRAEEVFGTISHQEYHRNLARPPIRVRNWRDQMATDEITLFEAIAGDLLEDLGYERRSVGKPPLSTRREVERARVHVTREKVTQALMRLGRSWGLIPRRGVSALGPSLAGPPETED